MRLLIANAIGCIGNWLLERADREPCRWANETDFAEACAHGVPMVSRIGGPSAYCESCDDALAANPHYYQDES